MTFKDQAAADLPTFLNVDEFAESVDIDGSAVYCVLEGNGDTEAPQDGVIDQDTLLYCKVSAFTELPVVGQRLTIDDEQANVIAVDQDQGLLILRLRWYNS